jgi:hypothetical protein
MVNLIQPARRKIPHFLTITSLLLLVFIPFQSIHPPLVISPPARSPNPIAPAQDPQESRLLYASATLRGHSIFAECNPGGTTHCQCDSQDASIHSSAGYGEVSANPLEQATFVNAIGFKKFSEYFPDGSPVSLSSYLYQGSFRLSALPQPDLLQAQNPQAVHLMIQFWDGRNALAPMHQNTLEGVIYWDLNPWLADYGSIKVYTYPAVLADTGLRLTPDLNWHTFALSVDLVQQRYRTVVIDGQAAGLSALPLAQVHHPDWNRTVMLSLTTESENAYPGPACWLTFHWETQYRDLTFRRLP